MSNMQKEIDRIVAQEKLADSLSKRNKGKMYKSSSFGYTYKKAEKEKRKLTQKEKRRLERDNARTVIDEESKADYSFIGKPMRKRTIRETIGLQPEENASYLNLKNASASQGSFKTGGLLIEPKFKKTARERRKEKKDKIGAGIIAGSALAGAAALYKTAKDKMEKDYGKVKKKKGGVAKKGKMIKLRGGGAAIRGTNFKGVF